MPSLPATSLNDLVQTTLRDLGKPNFTMLATNLQDYTFFDNVVMKKGRAKIDSGYGFQWDVQVRKSGNAAAVGLYATDATDSVDTMVQATADWRFVRNSWAIDEHEITMNSGSQKIVDIMTTRETAAMIDLIELMEQFCWGPPVDILDVITPWGIKTWMVKNATEGFNGGAPSGYTSIGLNPTTYPKWKNWTAQYTSVTKDDLVRKMRKASRYTRFKSPVRYPSTDTGYDCQLYTNYGVIQPLEEVLESQNENLGSEIAKYDGKLMFHNTPVTQVFALDADTTNPVYGINWGDAKVYIHDGWWGKRTTLTNKPGQHNVTETYLDYQYQMVFKNRRTSWVIATGTTEPS